MEDINEYPVAAQLIVEIHNDNVAFLLKVPDKIFKEIANLIKKLDIIDPNKSNSLKLFDPLTKARGKIIKKNQNQVM